MVSKSNLQLKKTIVYMYRVNELLVYTHGFFVIFRYLVFQFFPDLQKHLMDGKEMFDNDTQCDRSLDHSCKGECKSNFLTNCECNKTFCFLFLINFQNQKYDSNNGCDIGANVRSVHATKEKNQVDLDFGFFCILLTKTCDISTCDKHL